MSFIKNNSEVEFFNLTFLREIGPASTKDGKEAVLSKIFSYIVAGTNERDAIQRFLLQDSSHSPLSLEISHEKYYFDGKIPVKIKKLINLIDDEDMLDIDPENSDEDLKLYQVFIKKNLDLITDVLLLLDNKSIMFKIQKTKIII
jgi:hypothetical protein